MAEKYLLFLFIYILHRYRCTLYIDLSMDVYVCVHICGSHGTIWKSVILSPNVRVPRGSNSGHQVWQPLLTETSWWPRESLLLT